MRRRVSSPSLALWAVAVAVGAYLGYKIAEARAGSGLAILSVIVGAFIVAAILATLAVIAVIAARQSGGQGRSTALTLTLAGLLLVAGLGVGWSVKELGFGYRPSLVHEAQGTMEVSLTGIDGYAARVDVQALCRSEPDGERVAFVESNGVGSIGTGVVGASVVILPQFVDDPPAVQVWIVPADKSAGPAPSWRAPAGAVEPIDGDQAGRMAFSGAVLSADTQTPLEGWPTVLSGTIDWRCGAWLRDQAT